MQSSQYSIYNEYYKEELEKVYKTCGGSGPTEILPPPQKTEEKSKFCLTGKYHTTKEGDTCDSISKAAGVPGGRLYMANQEAIGDCLKIPAGLELCLPKTCKTYYVKPNETCFGIETSLGIVWDTIRRYNSWVNRDCSNLQKTTDFYGKSVCISPLDRDTSSVAKVSKGSAVEPKRKYSSGNTPSVLPSLPPDGAKVAEGTTMKCGSWHVVTESDTCIGICRDNKNCEEDAMYSTNPSLDKKDCDKSLIPGVALCVLPSSI